MLELSGALDFRYHSEEQCRKIKHPTGDAYSCSCLKANISNSSWRPKLKVRFVSLFFTSTVHQRIIDHLFFHSSSQYFQDTSIFKQFSSSVHSTLVITYVNSLEILTTTNTLEGNACLFNVFPSPLNLMAV